MAIKISQVAKDLNVGIPTLVDYLQKNNQDVEENNINMRITDEQYEMLVKAFKNDKDQKSKSDRYSSSRHKEKAKAHEAKKEEAKKEEVKVAVEPVSGPKVIGKIDLDSLNKPKPEPKPEPQRW